MLKIKIKAWPELSWPAMELEGITALHISKTLISMTPKTAAYASAYSAMRCMEHLIGGNARALVPGKALFNAAVILRTLVEKGKADWLEMTEDELDPDQAKSLIRAEAATKVNRDDAFKARMSASIMEHKAALDASELEARKKRHKDGMAQARKNGNCTNNRKKTGIVTGGITSSTRVLGMAENVTSSQAEEEPPRRHRSQAFKDYISEVNRRHYAEMTEDQRKERSAKVSERSRIRHAKVVAGELPPKKYAPHGTLSDVHRHRISEGKLAAASRRAGGMEPENENK